jgi:hypothetical protein
VSFRQEYIKTLTGDESLVLLRDAENPHDPNAVMVCVRADAFQVQIGFIPKALAADLAPRLGGDPIPARIVRLTGGTSTLPTRGIEISFEVKEESDGLL